MMVSVIHVVFDQEGGLKVTLQVENVKEVLPDLVRHHLNRECQRQDDMEKLNNLTLQETAILQCIGSGLTTSQIAQKLSISVHTVNTHRKRIKAKVNVTHITELARLALLLK